MLQNRNKIRLLFFILLIPFVGLHAQFANSWINYTQQYFAVKIYKSGIYRIDSSTLASAGIPLSTINPKNFQIFHNGKEIPLYIQGDSDNIFNSGDYIAFYGERNDGSFDTTLYGGAANDPNPYYSLYTDTSYYYLTWNSSLTNKRYTAENDTNFSAYTPQNYFLYDDVNFKHSFYMVGEEESSGLIDVDYANTECWSQYYQTKGGYKYYYVHTKNPYTAGPLPEVSLKILGESDYANVSPDHHFQVKAGSPQITFLDTTFNGYQNFNFTFNIPFANLATDSTLVETKSIPGLSTTYPNYVDNTTTPWAKITYPHTFDMGGNDKFLFRLPDQTLQTKSYAVFSNFNGGGNAYLYDFTNEKRIKVVYSGGNYKALIPNAGNIKQCYLIAAPAVNTVSTLYPVNGAGAFTDYNNMPLDTAFIIIYPPKLASSAMAYKVYRSSLQGGSFNAQAVNINELYDQFSYGIRKTPLAIRNFIHYVVDTRTFKPKDVFLFGKAVETYKTRQDTAAYNMNLVPTFGYPPSDNRIISGIDGTIFEPVVPIGRLSAIDNQEAGWYLDKVMDYESEPAAEWMKQILHFSGGSNVTEDNIFAGYLNGYAATMEDTSFGGNVTLFKKTTSVPIQTNLADSIKHDIQKGVSFMTFFGHGSSSSGFDQSIDDPSTWNNVGKYPFLVGDACYAGNIHLPSTNSPSEKMVLQQNQGLIGFLGSVDLGFSSILDVYSSELFRNIGQKSYGKSIGTCIQNTIKNIEGSGSNEYLKSVSLEMTLNGDPAIVLHAFKKPDFMIEPERVYFTPQNITTTVDSFDVNIIITNLGKAVNGSLGVEITRYYPENNKDTLYALQMPAVKYKDTLHLRMPVDLVNGIGLNTFHIRVDASSTFDELSEINNDVTVSVLIKEGNITPIYPYKYAIVPNQNVTLKASTGFAFEPSKKYIFQLDTTDLFNSPLLTQTTITSIGGIVSWQPALLQSMPDSMVYFWRVSADSAGIGHYDWKEFSFQYIPGKTGWSQYHIFQFKNDDYTFINYSHTLKKISFINAVKQLICNDIGNPQVSELGFILYKLDNDMQDYNVCGFTPSIHIAVIDSISLESWGTYGCLQGSGNCGSCTMVNANHQFGNANNGCLCRARPEKYFIYRTNNAASLDSMRNMLTNHIPNGDYVLAYSAWNPLFSNWDAVNPNIRQAFVNLGADTIQTLASPADDSLPYIFFVQKGHPNTAQEVVGNDKFAHITLSDTLHHNASYGNILSEKIGPAASYDSLFWRRILSEFPSADSVGLKIYGVNYNNEKALIYSNIPVDSNKMRITSLVQSYLTQYPFLELEADLKDDSLHTAPQLRKWQVTYEPAPEAAVAPKIHNGFYKDTLYEGQEGHFEIAVKNISSTNMDSLLISYKIIDSKGNAHILTYPRQAPLKADSVMISKIDFSTLGLSGNCTLIMEVNPNHDQLEQYHFNNFAEKSFYVISDKQNPLLNVTFDGIHILDNDIVSPEPHIVIGLKDENKYLALNDTSDFEIYITDPSGNQKRIYFQGAGGEQIMQFIPGNLPKNQAKILYNPNYPIDGTYKLTVHAEDRSRNNSGDIDYQIDFQVINKSTITQILNYPNPFTTATRFVFTLTGSKIPDVFKIQIMTITGRVVKEISKQQLGEIHIGRNISQYAWDGTDQFGDKLARGVYFYRVVTQIDGKDIDHRSSAADKYFKHNIGKMYLL